MGNSSINAFFSPSLHNYWVGAAPSPGPSPSYALVFWGDGGRENEAHSPDKKDQPVCDGLIKKLNIWSTTR